MALLIVYRVTLPEKEDADAFVKFIQDEYLPAVRTGPTRVGKVTIFAVLRGVSDTQAGTDDFLVHMGYSGLSFGNLVVDDKEVQKKFEAFGAKMERAGAYKEVAAWDEADLKAS